MLMSPLDEPMSDGEDKHSATTPLLINNPRLSTKASCCHNKTKHFHRKNSYENNQGYEDEKSHKKVLKDRNVQEVVCCNDETTSETDESFIEQGANH